MSSGVFPFTVSMTTMFSRSSLPLFVIVMS